LVVCVMALVLTRFLVLLYYSVYKIVVLVFLR